MSKKPLTNAQPAKEPTPTEKPVDQKLPETSAEDLQTSSPEPFQLIPPFKISGKTKGMAKAAGIDLDSIEAMAPRMNEWASSVEQRLNVIINAIPQLPLETIKLLRAEAEKQRSEIMQKTPAAAEAPAAGNANIMSAIAQFLPMITGGGAGGGVSDEITKQVIDAGIKQMFAGTRLLEAIQTKIMADMGVKAVTEAVTPK